MIIIMNKPVEVEVSTITIQAKCSDACFTQIKNASGEIIYEEDGYVPSFMPGKHYGDYIILDIDIKTGRILNWKNSLDVLEGIESMIKEGS